MKAVNFVALSALFAAALALPFAASGCKDAKKEKPAANGGDGGPSETSKTTPKKAIAAGTGTIKGKLVYNTNPPKQEKTEAIAKNEACEKCALPANWATIAPKGYENETLGMMDSDQTWIVGKNNTVANVLVRLKVPVDSYFEPSAADKDLKGKEVVIDQPCCAFVPHVVVLYPSYWDGKEQKSTGQVLLVKNSAGFSHNTKIEGDARPPMRNEYNKVIPSKGSETFTLNPQKNLPIPVTCDVHKMMNAKIFVYDHPYAVVTGMDGTFELKNVPTDRELVVEFWHEARPDFKSEKVTLKPGDTKDFGDISVGPK